MHGLYKIAGVNTMNSSELIIRPGGQYYRRPSVQRIYTASDSAACGAYFRIGEEYIITGD
uniref:Uncharacterized protein n=1 Tax=Magallana gigas TaxID=29159 RepID=K1P0Q0_MAGGI